MRALRKLVQIANEVGKPYSVFGVTAAQPQNLPFLIGVGLRDFCVPPVSLKEFVDEIAHIHSRSARRVAEALAASTCRADTLSLVESYRHGYVRD